MEVLLVEVEGQRFAIPSADVRELFRCVTVRPLPRPLAIIEGIINVRGTIVPVLDLRARFCLEARAPAHTDHLILAMAGPRPVALRADRAVELVRLAPGEVEDARDLLPGLHTVAGVMKRPEGLVLIHDLRTFLSQAESSSLDEALTAVGAGAAAP